MRKFSTMAAILALLGMLLPAAVLADEGHSLRLSGDVDQGLHLNLGKGSVTLQEQTDARAKTDVDQNDDDEDDTHPANRFLSGTVTAISANSFDVKTLDGSVFTVNVSSSTKLEEAFSGQILFSAIQVNDKVLVKGTESTTGQIDASLVVVTPPNTHPAIARGTVTAVNGTSFNVETRNGLVVTVNTNSNTTFQQTGTTSTTTIAAVQVGSKVAVRGLWDEILNILKAIRVRIFSH